MHLHVFTLAAIAALSGLAAPVAHAQDEGVRNIVLVHGAWADGSGWREVHDILAGQGYAVSVVGSPMTSLEDDVAAVDRVLARQDGTAILVGHSYGGAVITEAGDDPKVAGLVYVQAFAPDVGESLLSLVPSDEPPPVEPSEDGFLFLNKEAFLAAFADGVDPALAAFMASAQIPLSVASAEAPLTVAAWKEKPSWYQVADADRIIPTEAQRQMATRAGSTVVDVSGGHLAFMVNAQATADLIATAAKAAGE